MTRPYAAAALLLAGLTTGLLTACESDGGGNGDEPPAAEPGAVAIGPSYAVGGTIHRSGPSAGAPSIESPGPVQAFVETRYGAVWGTRDGRVLFGDGEEVQHIGRTPEHYLEADRDGSLVAWVEFPTGGPAELVVWDTAEREEVLRTAEGTTTDMRQRANFYSELSPWSARDKRPIAYVYAVEGRSVYWLNTDGAVRTDVDDDRTEVLEPDADELTIESVEDGLITSEYFDEDQPDDVHPVWVGPEVFAGTALAPEGSVSDLSPDATYVVAYGAGPARVVATSDGSVVAQGFEPRQLEPYAWTDDDTFQALGFAGGHRQLYECEVATSACRIAADVPPSGGRAVLVLPSDPSH